MWLNKRNSLILKNLIKIYISTHKPVSSNQLTTIISLSSPTIRKELQKLESYGYIFRTTYSSGRIPTNRGLKFYLRELMDNSEFEDKNFDLPEIKDLDFNAISEDFLSLLSEKTPNIGFIFLNSVFNLNFKKINLIKVGSHRIMLVILSLYNCTFSKILKTTENYSEHELRRWQNIINKEFKGKTLNNTFKIIRNRLFKQKEKYRKIYKGFYSFLFNKDLIATELFFKGKLNILNYDLINPHKIKEVLETLEDKAKLSKFFNDLFNNNKETPSFVFGSDTGISELDGLILIFSNFYYIKNPIGNIGIIGPKFMPFPNTISKIECYSSYFSKILSKKTMEV